MQCYNVCAQVSDLSAFTFLFCVRFIPPRLVDYVQPGATAEPGGHQANCGRSYSSEPQGVSPRISVFLIIKIGQETSELRLIKWINNK